MLRYDLREAGIPYRVEGPDGPLFADFHALRHTYIASLKRAGVSLSAAMRLARHGDPRLTAAVYGREDLDELASAVDLVAGMVAGISGYGSDSGGRIGQTETDREGPKRAEKPLKPGGKRKKP
jgi:hypothetical protein